MKKGMKVTKLGLKGKEETIDLTLSADQTTLFLTPSHGCMALFSYN